MKFPRFIYHQKQKDGYVVTRILRVLKFKRKITKEEFLFTPTWQLKPHVKTCGRHTYCGENCRVNNFEDSTIGSFCSIGVEVHIGHGNHPINFLTTSPFFYEPALGFLYPDSVCHTEFRTTSAVHIGNDVWIGNFAFIKNGVNIGDGAIIGAHSVVTKDVPPYAIVAGNPAKIIRYRFNEETIQKLLRLKWWEFDDEFLRTLPYENVNDCITALEQKRQECPLAQKY